MEGDLAAKSNMSGMRAAQQMEPEDDPHFVLAKANARESEQMNVLVREKDWSEMPDTSDRVPLEEVNRVLRPRGDSVDTSRQMHRGYNNHSGLIYYSCGMNQYKGKPAFGTTLLPRPQYVNPENVKYLNKDSEQPDEYEGICRLEVLRGINLAGGNKPAGDKSFRHEDIEDDRKIPTLPKIISL